MVNHVVKNWKRDEDEKVDVNLKLWCDNKSVLKAIDPKVRSTFVTLCNSEGALVHQTRLLLLQLKKVTLNHVSGRQDDSVPYERLPLPAQLNVDCNTRAKRMMQDPGLISGRTAPPEGTEITFYMRDNLVATNLDKRIQLALYGDDMISYLQDKYERMKSDTDSINFKVISLVKTRLSHASSIRVSKIMHE